MSTLTSLRIVTVLVAVFACAYGACWNRCEPGEVVAHETRVFTLTADGSLIQPDWDAGPPPDGAPVVPADCMTACPGIPMFFSCSDPRFAEGCSIFDAGGGFAGLRCNYSVVTRCRSCGTGGGSYNFATLQKEEDP